VSTASVVESEGVLYVALVATRPDMERRGFAEATMRNALSAASEATGYRKTCLHATQAGLPVYERMEYTPVTRIVGVGLASAVVVR
jgi:predicted acetyltransferase